MKILTILGARPQFIKAGSVSREIRRQADAGEDIEECIIHTGQHYDENMSDVFFKEMYIPKPDYFLGVGGSSHGAMTGQMIEKIEHILAAESPDWVMVYGDTNSTLAGAIAASKMKIKIAHVEAGLRSFNMAMPEEINRILTDRVSALLFCPTSTAYKNLMNEGLEAWQTGAEAIISGDVMQDGALFYRGLSQMPPGLEVNDDYVLCTIHRAENTDDPDRLGSLVAALTEIAKQKRVILPLHPRTRKILEQGQYDTSKLQIIEPVGYMNMVWLIDHCDLVMTDSGGLQKEAYFFRKPCITLRDETEWVELVDLGANLLVGAKKEAILRAFERRSSIVTGFEGHDPYGGGGASKRIVERLLFSSKD